MILKLSVIWIEMVYLINFIFMRRCVYKNNKKSFGFNYLGLSFNNIVVRNCTPIDSFYTECSQSSDDGSECIAYTDPIRMIFNQQRLSQLGQMGLDAWLDSLRNTKKDPLAELRKKCSDADLKEMIKSRHIQQPSEVMAWVQYCQSNMQTFESEVAKKVEARQAEEAAKLATTKENVEIKSE